MLASYHWFFRLVSFLCFAFGAIGLLLLPRLPKHSRRPNTSLFRLLDVSGVLLILGFLICFILGLTQGPIDGWNSPSFIAPFILSVLFGAAFFTWEYHLPAQTAILPRHVWATTNFTTSSLAILIPVGFWFTSQLLYATYWQILLGWIPIHVAAAILPQGIAGLLVGVATQFLPQIVTRPRISLPVGGASEFLLSLFDRKKLTGRSDPLGRGAADLLGRREGLRLLAILFPRVRRLFLFSNRSPHDASLRPSRFLLGSTGSMIVYFASAINIVSLAPPEIAGVVSAWTQVVAQIGAAITLAVQSAFEGKLIFSWRQSAGLTFWFIFAWTAALSLQFVIFCRASSPPEEEHRKYREAIAAKMPVSQTATEAA